MSEKRDEFLKNLNVNNTNNDPFKYLYAVEEANDRLARAKEHGTIEEIQEAEKRVEETRKFVQGEEKDR